MPEGLGFIASQHTRAPAIPGVNQPPPSLPAAPPSAPPQAPLQTPAPAPAPIPAPSGAPGQALLQPGGLTTRNILGSLSQVFQNLGAVAQGQPIPFSAQKIREAQLAEDKHRLSILEVQSKVIQNALKLRGGARTAYLNSTLAQLPGWIGQGVASQLEASTAQDEEQFKRQIDGFIDLNEEAKTDLMDIAATEGLSPYEAYHKYSKELDKKSALVSARKLSGLRDKFAGLIDQTSDKEAVLAELDASPPTIDEIAEFFPDHLTPADREAVKNYPEYFSFIKSPEIEKEERANKRALELEEVKQGNRMEIAGLRAGEAEHFETLPAEQAEAQGLTGEEPVYQRSRKTGKVTKIGGKAQGQGAEEKRGKEIRALAKQKMKDELMNAEEATAAATRELDALDRALTAPGEAPEGGPSQEDLEFTAQKHGLTVEEVRRRLGL